MRVLFLLVCVLGALVPQSECTFAAIAAALPAGALVAAPAIAAVGGLSAIKILKLVGLSKLKKKISASKGEYYDEYDDYDPYYKGYYGPPPLYSGTPPFYIVPGNYFDQIKRGKRSAQNAPVATGEAPKAIGEKDYFNVIGTLDADGCVLRLVCELSQIPKDQLKEDERVILSVFDVEAAPSPTAIRTIKGTYDNAAWIGQNAGANRGACGTVYRKCQSTAQQMMEAFRLMEAEELAAGGQGAPEGA